MDMAACDLFMETYPNNQTVEKMLEIRPYNADKTKNMRSLNPEGNSTISCYPTAAVHCLPQSNDGEFVKKILLLILDLEYMVF